MVRLVAGAAAETVPPIPLHSRRIGEIEMLRAVAVLLVLVEHVPYNLFFWGRPFFRYLSGFYAGVDLFFAISGFVIARSLLPLIAPLRGWPAFLRAGAEFWMRRAWRLLPSAWFWLTVPLVLCLAYNRSGAFQPLKANWEMFVSGILDIANFRIALIYGVHDAGTAFVQWSLSLEEQFYLLLPFAAFLLRRQLWVPLVLVAAAGFLVPNNTLTMQIRLWPVAIGVLLAMWSARPSWGIAEPTGLRRSRVARLVFLWLTLGCIVSLGTAGLKIVPFYQGPTAMLSGLLVWAAAFNRGYLWRPGRARRVLEGIGTRSYSIYLVHIPVFAAMHETWFRLYGASHPASWGSTVGYVVLCFAAVFAVAELNHRLLEMPLRERGKRIANTFATQPATVATG